jgi:hypothetical protein
MSGSLTPADLAMFARLGISPEPLDRARVERVTDAEARERYGVTWPGDLSGIVFPYFDPDAGHRVCARLRRDHPEIGADGKPERKYVCPYGDDGHLYFPPGAGALLADASVPVVIVEAEKSALAIATLAERSGRRLLLIATGGCYGWSGKNGIEAGPNGERQEVRGLLPDFERIAWLKRRVVIAFDANVASNRKVQAARQALARHLAERGANVHFCNLPQETDVNGPDDFIAQHGGEAFLALLDAAKPFRPVPGVLASEVKPEEVRWLWPRHIPLGKPTVFEGDPDEGKSTVALDLVARVSRGVSMPDGTAGIAASGAVVVSLEDGAADTIVPRLIAAGADRSGVRIIQTITGADGFERTPTLPGDLPAIEAAIKDVGAAILVIDPLVATLAAETNSYRDQDIRRVLAPVAALAERTGVAVIVIRHLNKSSNPNPKYRGGGSIGIIGAARAGFLFGPNPDEEGSKVMAPVKENLCAKPPAIKYRLEERNGTVAVKWEGETSHTARSILAEPETQEESNALADAKDFLNDFLKDGPQHSKEVERAAKAAGVAERTLLRAKPALRIKAKKIGIGKGQHWEWELPKPANGDPKAAINSDLAAFEENAETKPVNSNGSPKIAKDGNMAAFAGQDGSLRAEPGESDGLPLADDAVEF